MAAAHTTQDSHLMTLLVQFGASISGAMAVAVLAVGLWPKAGAPIPPSAAQQIDVQSAEVVVATPYVPEYGVLEIEVQKPPAKREIPSNTAPNPY